MHLWRMSKRAIVPFTDAIELAKKGGTTTRPPPTATSSSFNILAVAAAAAGSSFVTPVTTAVPTIETLAAVPIIVSLRDRSYDGSSKFMNLIHLKQVILSSYTLYYLFVRHVEFCPSLMAI